MTTEVHNSVQLNPSIPAAPEASTWQRFIFGFEPGEFTSWIDESESWKTSAFIGDWSGLTNKIVVKGPDAVRFFQDISVNSFANFDVGRAKHSVQCAEDGKIMCEGLLMRLTEDEVKFTSGPTGWAEYQFARGNYDATLTQHGLADFIIQVQGPNSLHILEKATNEQHRDYGFMRLRKTSIAGFPVWSVRQGMSGELGFELHGDGAHAVEVHQALLDAGAEYDVRRLGMRTKMVNHAEACFPTLAQDYLPAVTSDPGYLAYFAEHHQMELQGLQFIQFTGSYPVTDFSVLFRDPTELGWGKNISFDHSFVGDAALKEIVAEPKRTIVTLVWNKDDVIDVFASLFASGDPYEFMELPRAPTAQFPIDSVLRDGREVGVSTSRCYSYHFREMISLCSIDLDSSAPGTQVELRWGSPSKRQKTIRAIVAPAPYKTDHRRIDISSLPVYI